MPVARVHAGPLVFQYLAFGIVYNPPSEVGTWSVPIFGKGH